MRTVVLPPTLTSANVPQRFARSRTDRRHRILVALLAIPFLIGVLAAPVAAPGCRQGDGLPVARPAAAERAPSGRSRPREGTDREAQQLATSLAGRAAETKDEPAGITDNLVATRERMTDSPRHQDGQDEYQDLVTQLADLDHQLGKSRPRSREAGASSGRARRSLAARIREAYDTDRTSMLETFLSGATSPTSSPR